MRAVVGYTDFQNDNTAVNFRAGENLGDPNCDPTNPAQPAGTCRWNSTASSTAWNVSWFHKATDWIDYLLRYSQQNVDTNTDIIVAGGTPPVPGLSVYDVDTTHGLIQVNFRPAERWAAWVRSWLSDADGVNPLIAPGFTDNETARILQDYRDAEVGVRYTFPSKIFVGGSYRVFDYDDRNDLLDYDGSIFTLNAGMAF